jgi:uncharacterized protein YxjI
MDFNLYNISKKGFIFPKYEITENSKLLFTVKRKGLFSSSYVFYDSFEHEAMTLNYVFKFFKTNFNLFRDGQLLAKIKSTNGVFKNNFDVETDDITYQVGGSFAMKEFTINNGMEDVARVSRKSLSRDNRYGIAVDTEEDQELILGIAFAMEAVRIKKKQRSG